MSTTALLLASDPTTATSSTGWPFLNGLVVVAVAVAVLACCVLFAIEADDSAEAGVETQPGYAPAETSPVAVPTQTRSPAADEAPGPPVHLRLIRGGAEVSDAVDQALGAVEEPRYSSAGRSPVTAERPPVPRPAAFPPGVGGFGYRPR